MKPIFAIKIGVIKLKEELDNYIGELESQLHSLKECKWGYASNGESAWDDAKQSLLEDIIPRLREISKF